MIKDLTICIITHAIKVESRGDYANMNQSIPTAPSTKLVELILEDLFNKTKLPLNTHIVVGVDNRIGREIDNLYVQNLKKLTTKYSNLVVVPNNSTTYDPLISAPQNFCNAIGAVKTPYYLLWEHDWIFTKCIDLSPLIKSMEKHNTFYVRFNQHTNVIAPGKAAETFMIPETNTDVPLLKVDHMGNNPYICKTEVFNKWWKHLLYETPEQGGFVEGPINVFYKFAISKMGFEHANKQWGIYLYGSINELAYVSHLNGYRVR